MQCSQCLACYSNRNEYEEHLDICRVNQLLKKVKYENYNFYFSGHTFRPFLQIRCIDTCVNHGNQYMWYGRKWFISYYMTDSEIIQTAFKAVMCAVEHETRERFTYRGQAIFRPHYDVDSLYEFSRTNPISKRMPNNAEE